MLYYLLNLIKSNQIFIFQDKNTISRELKILLLYYYFCCLLLIIIIIIIINK